MRKEDNEEGNGKTLECCEKIHAFRFHATLHCDISVCACDGGWCAGVATDEED